jgi:hypothetical protein
MSVLIRVDPRDLDLQKHGVRWSGAIGVGLAQLGAAGERYSLAVRDIDVSVAAEDDERAMEGDLGFRMRCNRDARASFLRVAVVDKSRGHLGSLSIPLGK